MLGTKEQRTEGMKRQANELIEQAYDRGFKAGYDKAFATLNENWQLVTSEAEEKGRNEAWEAARKIYLSQLDGGISGNDLVNIFGYPTNDILARTTASEAIEKIREYEEKKKREEEPKLKPCPFCGSTDIRIYRPAVEYYVRCHNCFVTKGEFDTEEEATDEWNKRAGGSE